MVDINTHTHTHPLVLHTRIVSDNSDSNSSFSKRIWWIHLEQSLHFCVPLLDNLHCLFENLALIFLLVHPSHCRIALYSNPTGLGNGVAKDNLLILPKFNMVGKI